MKTRRILGYFLCPFIMTACTFNKESNHVGQTQVNTHEAEWSYMGESSPEHWTELSIGSDCGGQHQSPINILEVDAATRSFEPGHIRVEYEKLTHIESITNNGHTIQYNFDAENHIFLKNRPFKLEQFHFHAPSEHTINGIRYPLETHLVHHSLESNAYIVFSILVQQGAPDTTFTFLEKFLPIANGETKTVESDFCLSAVHPEILRLDSFQAYSYHGSLTTPPCTERVLWFVFKNPISASPYQIKKLQELMPTNNYRNSQPLNGREVVLETLIR